MSKVRVGFVPTAGQLCLWLLFLAILHLLCPGVGGYCVAMRTAEQMDGGLETAILGGAAKITEKGDFVFLSPFVGVCAEERSRMGVEIASQSSGWGRSFPADSACHRSSWVQQNTVSFSTGVSKTTYKKPLGTRLRCKPAQSSTRIRRGDRELGFVAPRSAWPGRMGPVESYTRRSHARCREIADRRWRRFPPSFESDQDEV